MYNEKIKQRKINANKGWAFLFFSFARLIWFKITLGADHLEIN
jgi:hypothetical protein